MEASIIAQCVRLPPAALAFHMHFAAQSVPLLIQFSAKVLTLLTAALAENSARA